MRHTHTYHIDRRKPNSCGLLWKLGVLTPCCAIYNMQIGYTKRDVYSFGELVFLDTDFVSMFFLFLASFSYFIFF